MSSHICVEYTHTLWAADWSCLFRALFQAVIHSSVIEGTSYGHISILTRKQARILFQVSIAAMKHHDPKQVKEKRVYLTYTFTF